MTEALQKKVLDHIDATVTIEESSLGEHRWAVIINRPGSAIIPRGDYILCKRWTLMGSPVC